MKHEKASQSPPPFLLGSLIERAQGKLGAFGSILGAMGTVRKPGRAGKEQVAEARTLLEDVGIDPDLVAGAESLIDTDTTFLI